MVGTADWAWPGSQKWRGWLKPGWVRVGRCTCGCRHCSSMENLHGVGPFPQIPGTVQCLGAASGFPHVPGRAVFSLCARVLPGHALEGDAAFYRLPSLDLLWYPQTGESSCPAPHSSLCMRATQEPPARTHLPINPWCLQVEKQETWCFPAYGMAVGLWLMVSSIPRRRLVLNHTRGMYHFSIRGRTVCQGPMHLVYVRLALSSDGDVWDRRGKRGEGVGEGCEFRAGRDQ